jgi:hypothetical protein
METIKVKNVSKRKSKKEIKNKKNPTVEDKRIHKYRASSMVQLYVHVWFVFCQDSLSIRPCVHTEQDSSSGISGAINDTRKSNKASGSGDHEEDPPPTYQKVSVSSLAITWVIGSKSILV